MDTGPLFGHGLCQGRSPTFAIREIAVRNLRRKANCAKNSWVTTTHTSTQTGRETSETSMDEHMVNDSAASGGDANPDERVVDAEAMRHHTKGEPDSSERVVEDELETQSQNIDECAEACAL
mmetsp:Transcript_144976/g.463289  ORF Transcript_144976/g.463289 Transcript_144976/m.463289 type:complete len:122 (-) Transcript_144976:158-523(-)